MADVYQLEVSNKLGSWGAAGKVFRPGLYKIVDNDPLVEIARASGPYVQVWKVGETGELSLVPPVSIDAMFDSADVKTGPLTRDHMVDPKEPTFACPKCGTSYTTVAARDAHLAVAHPAGDDFFEGAAPPEDGDDDEGDIDDDEGIPNLSENESGWDEPTGAREAPPVESGDEPGDAPDDPVTAPGEPPSASEEKPGAKPSKRTGKK